MREKWQFEHVTFVFSEFSTSSVNKKLVAQVEIFRCLIRLEMINFENITTNFYSNSFCNFLEISDNDFENFKRFANFVYLCRRWMPRIIRDTSNWYSAVELLYGHVRVQLSRLASSCDFGCTWRYYCARDTAFGYQQAKKKRSTDQTCSVFFRNPRTLLSFPCRILLYRFRQIFHRSATNGEDWNQKIWTVLPDLFRELFIELNMTKEYNDVK